MSEVGVHAQQLHGFLHVLHPGAQLRSLTGDRGFRGAKEVGYGHGARIQELIDPLPSRPFSLGPLLGDSLLPAAGEGGYPLRLELLTKLLDGSESHIRHLNMTDFAEG